MIGWIATALSLTGIYLMARKKTVCWPVHITASCFWMALGFKYRDASMVVSQVFFISLNAYGWYCWAKKGPPK